MVKFIKNWILGLSFVQKEITFFQTDKEFLLSRKIVKDALLEAEIKAFPKAQKDILETMADDLDKRANELAKQKLNDLLSPVDLNFVATLNKEKGMIFIGGERADEIRLSNLHQEAEALVKFDLWNLLCETPKELAQRAMFVQGESLADLQKGKSILYTLSTQRNILEIFMKYEPKKK